MVVCAHGAVSEFCEQHEMVILESFNGDLNDYKGSCPVIVTDKVMTREEYDSLKCVLFGRGVELVSTEWTDDEVIVRLLRQAVEQRGKRGGRQMFGYYKKNGVIVENPGTIAVARRVIALRDAGRTLREIREDDMIRHMDGKKLATSTIQQIIKNRGRYE